MSPGTYFQKRREAAGLTVEQLAVALGVLPDTARPIRAGDFSLLRERIAEVEVDQQILTLQQAALVHRVVPLDLEVYELLLVRHFCETPTDFPEPQICPDCGARWLDTCAGSGGPAALPADSPKLSTFCRDRAAIPGATPAPGENA